MKKAIYSFTLKLLVIQLSMIPLRADSADRIRMAQNRIKVSRASFEKLVEAENGIPSNVLAKAKAIAIFPAVAGTKGFWQQSIKSEGVVSRRFNIQGWTAPAFFELSRKTNSGIKRSPSAIILIFNEDSAVDKLRENKVKVFERDSIAVGPTKNGGIDPPLPTTTSDILYYEYVEGVSITPNLRDLVLKPNNADSKAALGYDSNDILFYKKEAAISSLQKHETLYAFTQALNFLPPNTDITPQLTEFFDAGYDYTISKSLETIKLQIKHYLNQEGLFYREEETDKGVLITTFLELNEVTRRHRRAAFLFHIMLTNQTDKCRVLLKLHVRSRGYREGEDDYTTLPEDKLLTDKDPRIKGKEIKGEEMPLKRYMDEIGKYLEQL